MNHRRFPSSLFPLSTIFLALQVMLRIPQSSGNPYLTDGCLEKRFICGNIYAGYPFSGDGIPAGCRHPGPHLYCENKINTTTEIGDGRYQVLNISLDGETVVLKLAREDWNKSDLCDNEFQNSFFDYELFDIVRPDDYAYVSLFYGCPNLIEKSIPPFNCGENGNGKDIWVVRGKVDPSQCSTVITIPILKSSLPRISNPSFLLEVLKIVFEVKWKERGVCEKCERTGGTCSHPLSSAPMSICNCPDPNYSWDEMTGCPPHPPAAPPPAADGKKNNTPLITGLGIAGAVIAGILIGIGFFRFRQHRRKKIAAQVKTRDLPTPPSSKGPPSSSTSLSQSISSYPTPKYHDLEKGSTYFGAHVFSYEELEEATENFNPSKELGEGGFGTVYYGVLNDGRVVAVKRLYENNFKRVDQYMNEIAILTRIRHPNLVILYGCTSRRSRELLLVYEYIPNGTVADHLHGKFSNSGLLTWPVRLSIAVETANALAYLHATVIIHRDVKTNNILLGKNFHVKVADFGLSRLFPNDVTHVSTAPQGTPGYVDPEYYQCYQLTEKSDVYSFGVVLIELISSKQAVDTNRHRHDINLANMAVSRIQNHALHELVDPSLGFENDNEVRKMMTAVAELAFRCLQQDREMRPSMEEVLEILREIQNEELEVQKNEEVLDKRSKAEVADIRSDDVGLLKHVHPLSPNSVTDKWMQIRSM